MDLLGLLIFVLAIFFRAWQESQRKRRAYDERQRRRQKEVPRSLPRAESPRPPSVMPAQREIGREIRPVPVGAGPAADRPAAPGPVKPYRIPVKQDQAQRFWREGEGTEGVGDSEGKGTEGPLLEVQVPFDLAAEEAGMASPVAPALFNSPQSLVRGLVIAEVLSPPLAKRHSRRRLRI